MNPEQSDHPARYWRPLPNGQVACDLCPVGCRLRPGQEGPCASRVNRNRRMELLQYGRIVSAAVDPIEKKPLYHFFPGRDILSVAAPGCNLHCLFCQNSSISQDGKAPTRRTTPDELVSAAVAAESVGIAFTYSEPLVWFEFVKDTAVLARKNGLKNVLVTNGYLNPEPLAEMLPLIDAANIDLKSLDDRFYRRVCKGRLEPVLNAIRAFHGAGVHLELTNLIIPGHNDAEGQIAGIVDFVADLDPSIPLHFSAYHPAWRMKAPPTPTQTLLRARALAEKKLDWVYLGNAALSEGRDTLCRECGAEVITRSGFHGRHRFQDDRASCPSCGKDLPVVIT